ncbi:uncharacterized protein LTR77_002047 [Saxophila tyrrhenica]|uniref:Uncharacterized protein n=1 Tax=Saxophila tyrrhenica TaxID=1690608 RepID=A0AAV9PM19_9PEZI|nr:hypothetical protein LTR77_002047 [Saxophila tyrrhenica]
MSDLALDPQLKTLRTDTLQRTVSGRPHQDAQLGQRADETPAYDILQDHDLAAERAQTWTGIARFGFNAMLASPMYRNKLRLKPAKMERIVYFLTTPDAKSQERHRADAQVKHQAQQWGMHNGLLYRKADRAHQIRRHVGADEAFDVITAEHLLANHPGRDKMLKLLEVRYIGYTKEELMYVLDHCLAHCPPNAQRYSDSQKSLLMDETNYLGAAIFWLYILAALFFSSVVIWTILNIKQTGQRTSRNGIKNSSDTWLFSALAGLSFATLSANMLNVLIQSYRAWSARHSTNASLSPTQIWHWSITSTLFQDFGEAIVKDSVRYFWAQSALLGTLSICIFMGVEGGSSSPSFYDTADCLGRQRQIPRLWAFFGLSQILPISFMQNLFYLALLRQPIKRTQTLVPITYLLAVVVSYCACLLLAPAMIGGSWLITIIVEARFFLLAPLVILHSAKPNNPNVGELMADRSQAQSVVLFAALGCSAYQIYRLVQDGVTGKDVLDGLFDHPAVSSMGCDFILSAISYGLWTFRGGPSARTKVA